MKFDQQLPTRRMSPEDVLAVFQAASRFAMLKTDFPTYETKVKSWVLAVDEELDLTIDELNRWFQLDWSERDWHQLCDDTFYELCTAIAREATAPVIEPWSIAGATCPAAGAFRALCTGLQRRGIHLAGITPSASLDELMRHHGDAVVIELARLAPERLPPLAFRPVERDLPRECRRGVTAHLVLMFFAWLIPKIGLFLTVGGWLWHLLCWMCPPQQPYFEGIRTFRELSYRLAGLPAPVRPRLA